jgi:hypothetical protein
MNLGAERRQYMFDWEKINQAVNPEPVRRLEYTTNKHLFRKVAFDAYKVINGNPEQLWELRDGDDGKTYLYALYGDTSDLIANSENIKTKEWQATADSDGENVTLSYKKVPIYRFAFSKYPFTVSDAGKFANFIETKAEDPKWVSEFVNNAMSAERKAVVLKLIQGD